MTVDNDALFRCILAPQARDFLQVVGWLEDSQNELLGGGGGGGVGSSPLGPSSARDQLSSIQASLFPNQASSSSAKQQLGVNTAPKQRRTPIMLPDGQLYISRVQLRDANKSYRCQVRNQLNGKVRLSSIGGRLFVTGKYISMSSKEKKESYP